MSKRYFKPINGGRWTASRLIEGRWVALIQDTRLFHPQDAVTFLSALTISPTEEHLDVYFPLRGAKGRCPTLELLELFVRLPPGTGEEVGV
jgi:hypothetical protein